MPLRGSQGAPSALVAPTLVALTPNLSGYSGLIDPNGRAAGALTYTEANGFSLDVSGSWAYGLVGSPTNALQNSPRIRWPLLNAAGQHVSAADWVQTDLEMYTTAYGAASQQAEVGILIGNADASACAGITIGNYTANAYLWLWATGTIGSLASPTNANLGNLAGAAVRGSARMFASSGRISRHTATAWDIPYGTNYPGVTYSPMTTTDITPNELLYIYLVFTRKSATYTNVETLTAKGAYRPAFQENPFSLPATTP